MNRRRSSFIPPAPAAVLLGLTSLTLALGALAVCLTVIIWRHL